MIEPRSSVERFVKAIVRAELARHPGTHRADVVQHVMTRLHQELGKLIGPAGFDVLLARALVLTRRVHPVLASVTAGPGGALMGLDEAVRGGDGQEAAATAIVAHFIELLVTLVGEDLAMRLVREVYTAVDADEEEGGK